jgi:chromosome segregation ATPase
LTLKPTRRMADTGAMTPSDEDPPAEGEREALATLLERFHADRDLLLAAVRRAETMVHDLGGRLDAVAACAGAGAPAAEVVALRAEVGRLASTAAMLQTEVARTAEALERLRGEVVRRAQETEARLGGRLDAIVAGIEAEARAVQEALWDRVAGAEEQIRATETALAERLASVERAQVARSRGMLACVRDEVVAAVMMVVSIGAVIGRLTLSLVR